MSQDEQLSDLGFLPLLIAGVSAVANIVGPLLSKHSKEKAARKARQKSLMMTLVQQKQQAAADKKWEDEQKAILLAKTREAAQNFQKQIAAAAPAAAAPAAAMDWNSWALPLAIAGGVVLVGGAFLFRRK
jgi:hypothetical protein